MGDLGDCAELLSQRLAGWLGPNRTSLISSDTWTENWTCWGQLNNRQNQVAVEKES